jgi:DNA polymerase I-like protein with 3'-5' exonuclease and polymerase domains
MVGIRREYAMMSLEAEIEACHERVHELTEGLLQIRDELKFSIEAHQHSLQRIEALVADYMKPTFS